jgi:CelD/BcsL family acetyltransferase involved in cellulose biosynthesis
VAETVYPDLQATVFPDAVPAGVADELPDLYSSLPCTLEWFACHDRLEPQGACVLDGPRHVLLFRALPQARRIHLEVMFPPAELRLARRTLNSTDHMVAHLPGSVEAYTATLGKSTRQNLRLYENRLRRDHPDVSVRTIRPAERSRELFDRFLEWKRERFAAQGRAIMWDTETGLSEGFVELARRRGEVQLVSAGGDDLSILFAFPVGHAMYGAQAAFRPDCERYRLGLLAYYWLAGDAIGRGLSELNLMWGTGYYKERLGARPKRATRVSVFRSQQVRVYSLDEATEIAVRNVKRAGKRYYWSARHAAGRATRAVTGHSKPGART